MHDQKAIELDLATLAPVTPCPKMTGWLSRYADGTLRGLPRAYTRYHATHCSHCRETIDALTGLVEALHRQKAAAEPMTETEWSDLEARLAAVESEQATL